MITGFVPVVQDQQKVKVQVLQIIMLVELLVENAIMVVVEVLLVKVMLQVLQMIVELLEILV